MFQIQDPSEKKFDCHDLVLWHTVANGHRLLIPGVVVRQEESTIIIRARVDGTVKEIAVSPLELVER